MKVQCETGDLEKGRGVGRHDCLEERGSVCVGGQAVGVGADEEEGDGGEQGEARDEVLEEAGDWGEGPGEVEGDGVERVGGDEEREEERGGEAVRVEHEELFLAEREALQVQQFVRRR